MAAMAAPRRVSNPKNPWESTHVEWLGEPPAVELAVYEEEAHSILSRNESPDVPFRWSVNPYRGCQHACAYCYARPTHQYLGFGAGTDFDSKIVAKVNAPELLREAFARRSWKRECVVFSGVTDCYQPLEATYGLTRKCLEVCAEFQNPVSIVTKGALVRRDVDLLADSRRLDAQVFVSIPFADDPGGTQAARAIEPLASAPSTRFETLRILSGAGVETGVALAPMIPGLNDAHVPSILRRARECGARHAFMILLRLPAEVREVFVERLRQAFPDRADKVLSALLDVRQGKLSESAFGARMSGRGPRWEAIEQLFDVHSRKLGFEAEQERDPGSSSREAVPVQRLLFEER
jgi:DNA repair photolyase